MTNSGVSLVNLEEVMEEIRSEVEQRRRGDGGTEASSAGDQPPEAGCREVDPGCLQWSPGEHPPSFPADRSRYHLDDFLCYHDRDFIRNAYLGILQREPDPEGASHYLKMLRSGIFSKEEIVGQLRYSREGRAKKVSVRGLLLFRLLQFIYRVPVLGYFTQLAVGIVHLPRVLNNLRRLDTSLHGRIYDLDRAVVRTADESRADCERIDESLQSMAEQLEDKADLHLIEFLETVKADRVELLAKADVVSLAAKADLEWVKNEMNAKAGIGWVERLLAAKVGYEDLAAKADLSWVQEALQAKADVRWVEQVLNEEAEEVPPKEPESTDLAVDLSLVPEIPEIRRRQEEFLGRLRETVDRERARDQEVLRLRRTLIEQERRLRILLQEVHARAGELPAVENPTSGMAHVWNHFHDAYYVSFEDQFRGTREDIKQRAEVYLQVIRATGAGGERSPVVDIGCGRGELLELFQDHGLVVRGVDYNEMMVRECREWGLDVVQGEACAYLREAAAGSIGAITALHLIEHLPFTRLLELIDNAFRALNENGVLILETPNPKNILVGACDFYIDPTHRNPIHPASIQYIIESRGFGEVGVFFFEDRDGKRTLLPADQVAFETLDDYLNVSRDFTVLARKNNPSP